MTTKTKTEEFLRNTLVPVNTKSYTKIPHGAVIDKVRDELNLNNFVVTQELYKGSTDGNVALGFMKINNNADPDMSMTFNWINSYNKQLRFGCAIGGFIHDNQVPFISSKKQASWSRKHTGPANTLAYTIIEEMVSQASSHFAEIITMKNKFKNITIDSIDYAKLMGLLYFDKNIISPEQAAIILKEYKKPTFQYNDKGTLWEVYKMIMYGIAEQHPAKWYSQQLEVNDYIQTIYNISQMEENFDLDNLSEENEIAMAMNRMADDEAEIINEDLKYKDLEDLSEEESEESEEDVNIFVESIAEHELEHQLYGVDNDNIEVSLKVDEEDKEDIKDTQNLFTYLEENSTEDVEENDDNFIDNLLNNKIEQPSFVKFDLFNDDDDESFVALSDEDEDEDEEIELEEVLEIETTPLPSMVIPVITEWPANVIKILTEQHNADDEIINTVPMNDKTIYVLKSGDFFIV